MKFYKIVGLLFFVTSQIAVAQQDSIDTSKQQALAAQISRFSAIVNADIKSLQELLADELTYSHTTGWTESKTGFISTVESKKINFLSIIPRDVNVRIYGNTAVITGLANVKGIVSSGPKEITIRFLEVSRQVNGSWRLVAWQSVKNVKN